MPILKRIETPLALAPKRRGHRTILYGPGGIGKTTLCASLPGVTRIIDGEESLEILKLDHLSAGQVNDWKTLRDLLAKPIWDDVQNIVLDSGTRAERWAIADTLANVKHEKGYNVKSIEGYGFGKGFTHVYETFITLLDELDKHVRAGRNVVIICHDCTTEVPNPEGEDWLRYEPRLQSPNSGKASIRLAVKEWADHVLFYGYDVVVGADGKGKGDGTRTIYPTERPFCMAKSRTTQMPIAVTEGVNVWAEILK